MAVTDLIIILTSACTITTLFVLQIISIRVNDNDHAPRISIRIYTWGLLFQCVVAAISYMLYAPIISIQPVYFIALSSILYVSVGYVVYVFIFGLACTSIRTHLVGVISASLNKGCTYSQIINTYNIRIMVRNRLKRLLRYGVITESNGVYQAKKTISILSFANTVWIALKVLYSRN